MQIVRSLTLGAAIAIAAGLACAAQESLTFTDQLCTYKVHFDPAVYDRERLQATAEFVTNSEPPLVFGPTFSKPADAAAYEIGDYQSECGAREGLFWQPKFIDLPGIEELRKQKIAEVRDFCQLTEKKIEAAKGRVAALGDYAPAAPHCRRWVDALSADAGTLRTQWPDFAHEFCRNNDDEARCVKQHLAEADAADGIARMKLTLLDYGWSNCANERTLFNQGGEPGNSGSERLRKQLAEALARKVTLTQTCAGSD